MFKLDRTDLNGQETVQNFEGQSNVAIPANNPIRRGFPLSESIYIAGCVQGVHVNYVVDTGAEKTVVSKNIYNRIDDSCKPSLQKKTNYYMQVGNH